MKGVRHIGRKNPVNEDVTVKFTFFVAQFRNQGSKQTSVQNTVDEDV